MVGYRLTALPSVIFKLFYLFGIGYLFGIHGKAASSHFYLLK